MYGILLVNECCGTLGTAVNEAYFALFPMGAHVTGMTPIESHIIRWTTLHVLSCSTTATAFSGRSFQTWVISALSRFGLGRFGQSRFGPG